MAAEFSHEMPLRHVLIPVDESPASLKVFEYTLSDLYKKGDTIHLFHCIPPGRHVMMSPDLGMEEVVEDDEETRKKVESHAREFLLKTFVPRLDELKIPYQIEIVRFGTDADSVGTVICERADQLNAGLVVMAKHNKGAIKEFFIGSSTNYCTHHCKSPILVLHCDA
eukprot:gene21503-28484_t